METNIEDKQEAIDLSATLFVQVIASLLKDDEGMIVHHEGVGYVVFSNSADQQIQIMEDEEYLLISPGTLIWMHYDGSTAPEPGSEELDLRFMQDCSGTKH